MSQRAELLGHKRKSGYSWHQSADCRIISSEKDVVSRHGLRVLHDFEPYANVTIDRKLHPCNQTTGSISSGQFRVIISQTPFRISFFGGGTDYPAWYKNEGGAVLSAAIDKYCYISCRVLPPFFNIKHRIVWSHIETVSSITEILHPAVRAGLRYLGFDDSEGLEIHHQGDLPARSGVGSSSSFAVGLLNALYGMHGKSICAHKLALDAIELEQVVLNEAVGSQDQVAAAYGGFNHIRFARNGDIEVEALNLPPEREHELLGRLLLFYLGTSRLASDAAARFVACFDRKRELLRRMQEMVDRARTILEGPHGLDEIGHMLHEAWSLKRSICAEVTNSRVDRIYEIARTAGALGGKLMGAGGTGFMIFYVPPDRQAAVKEALATLLSVPFRISKTGSRLIHSSEEFWPADAAYPSSPRELSKP